MKLKKLFMARLFMCMCVSNEFIMRVSWLEWRIERKWERNAAACWSKHKRDFFFGTGKGNVRGRNKNCYQHSRVQSPRERKRYPPGWKVDACVSVCVGVVEKKKVSLLFRGLVNIMTNQTVHLICAWEQSWLWLWWCFVCLLLLLLIVAANLAFSSFHCCLVIVCLFLWLLFDIPRF